MSVKITDLVDENAMQQLKDLQAEFVATKQKYIEIANELVHGLKINVEVVGDIDKLNALIVTKAKEASEATERLNNNIRQQNEVIANTTNTISRQLMEQERVNKTTREAYTEYDKVKKLLDHYHDTYEGQVQSLVKINRQLQINKKEQTENEKALNQGRISIEQYASAQADLITQQRALQQEKKSLTQLMTAEEKAMQAGEGSYVKMSQQLELLKKAYKDLSDEGRNSDYGKELEATIQNLDAHLKDMAADMGEFQRNVGNYAVSNGDLKKHYEELVGTLAVLQTSYANMSEEEKNTTEGQQLAANIQNVSEAAKQAKQAITEQTTAVENAKASLGDMSTNSASVKKDLKDLVLEIANLSIEYQNLSDEEKNSASGQELAAHIADLTERAGVLKDAIADTNQAITNAASDTRGFDQLTGALDLAINGFGLATGAAEILGISEGELTAIQTKLQAAMATSNALTKIQNTLQKQSALMQGVNVVQTKLRTTAENLLTASQGKGVVTTKLLTVAQKAFNAAAKANPIGLLVTTIVACISAVAGLTKVFSLFSSDSEKRKAQLKDEAEALEGLKKAYEEQSGLLEALGKSQAYVYTNNLAHLKALREQYTNLYNEITTLYDSDTDEYKSALDNKKQADEDYQKEYEAAIRYLAKIASEEVRNSSIDQAKAVGLLHEYKVLQIEKEIAEYKKLYKTLKEEDGSWSQTAQDAFDRQMDSLKQRRLKELEKEEKDEAKKRLEAAKKSAEELRKAVEAGEDALINIITNTGEREIKAEELKYTRKKKQLETQLSALGAKETTMRNAIYKQLQSLETEHEQKMAIIKISNQERTLKTEESIYKLQLEAVGKNLEQQKEIRLKQLNNQEKQERLAIEKGLAENKYTVEQAEQMKNDITQKYGILRIKLENDFAQEQADIILNKYGVEEIKANDAYSKAINAAKEKYAKELALAKGDANAREKVKKELDDELYHLEVEYTQNIAQATIKMIEEILSLENLSAEDRLKWENELANAKINLANKVADANATSVERQMNDDDKLRDKRKENLNKWLGEASDAIGKIGDLAKTLFDEQIASIEEEQEANEDAKEKELERITELEENKVITKEEAEARKRAAEDKTAKKDEELEKKKAQIQYKQALWEKATDLAQAGISTALGIMETIASVGFPAAIPMIAVVSALGAIQMATIAATPIPKYAKGTGENGHPGGFAIVGDGGKQEIVLFDNKMWITPDTPTIADIPKGAVVYPDIDSIKALAMDDPLINQSLLVGYDNPKVIVNNDYSELRREIKEVANLIKRLIVQQHRDAYNAQYTTYKNSRM